MAMLKHIGRHGDKRIVLVYRQIPNDEHMCLVVYSDMLPQMVHDEVMKVLESPVGQQSPELADALFRATMADGRNCLEALHRGGMLKKAATNQITITPNAKSSVRLDELNKILNEMAQGEEAIKKLAELDSNAGLTTKNRKEPKEVGVPAASRSQVAPPSQATLTDVLSDDQLASQRIAQAAKMKLEAKQLMAEAERLEKEAESFNVQTKSNGKRTTKKASKKQAA